MARRRQYEVVTIGDIIKAVSIWVVDIVVVAALAFSLTYLFGTRVHMEGNSMTPTLSAGDKMLLNRMKGRILPVKRYDIVAYRLPGQEAVFLKRVLALPGETVKISEGKVYIDGEELPESDYTRSLAYAGVAAGGITLREGEYFVIGENADASLDSRFSDVGNIPAEDILGTVWLRYAPFRNLRIDP